MITVALKTKQPVSEFVGVKIPHGLCARIEVNRKTTNLTLDEFDGETVIEYTFFKNIRKGRIDARHIKSRT